MAFPSTHVHDFYANQLLIILTLLKIHQNLEVAILKGTDYFNSQPFLKPLFVPLLKHADHFLLFQLNVIQLLY